MMSYKRSKDCRPVEGTNICNYFKVRHGNVEEAFGQAHRVFSDRYTSHAVNHAPMEVHAALAQMTGNKLTVWTHNDAPYRCRRELSEGFGLPKSSLRIISLPMGGGFGGKGGLNAEPIAGLLAVHAKGRPVRVVFTREEVFTSTMNRHSTVNYVETAVDRDGRLLGRQVKVYWDTGAYAEKGPTVCTNAGYSAAGPYRIPNVQIDSLCVYTNNPVAGAFRGYGIPQVTWASECQLDEIAHELGLDPLEFRLRNALREGDISPTGEKLISVGVRDSLLAAAEAIGWGAPKQPRRGQGIAVMCKGGAAGYGSSSAFLKINEDGTVQVISSSVEAGQGAQTMLTQVVADSLGVDPGQVSLATPDTDLTPYDRSTTASRTTFCMGMAVKRAAEDVKAQLLDLGAKELEAAREDLELVHGEVCVIGSPGQSVAIGRLAHEINGERAILGRGEYHVEEIAPLDAETGQSARPVPFWMYGAQAAEVEVDEETGQVRVLRLVAAHDVGKAINPMTCVQQLEGAMAMGLGCALTEEIVLEKGKTLNPTFLDYRICSALDIPELKAHLVEVFHPDGPFGAKGVGEPALAPTAAAIANAVRDAIGIRFKALPLTPEAVWLQLRDP
jgi:carbon-monoxide dehydrogenase large subunit